MKWQSAGTTSPGRCAAGRPICDLSVCSSAHRRTSQRLLLLETRERAASRPKRRGVAHRPSARPSLSPAQQPLGPGVMTTAPGGAGSLLPPPLSRQPSLQPPGSPSRGQQADEGAGLARQLSLASLLQPAGTTPLLPPATAGEAGATPTGNKRRRTQGPCCSCRQAGRLGRRSSAG